MTQRNLSTHAATARPYRTRPATALRTHPGNPRASTPHAFRAAIAMPPRSPPRPAAALTNAKAARNPHPDGLLNP